VALRLHLDETPMQNGALRVIVRSHCSGRLSRAEIRRRVESGEEVFCEVGAGGVIAMRPLLLHASSACAEPAHRRVLHFENSSTSLPGGLEWLDGEPTPEVG
jgi:ectoine hydroxylase-related dioxygenase (phytanoyl-CoA dioxygenase family)